MRFVAVALVLSSFALTPPRALAGGDKILDAEALAALELQARQAQPREQCFLYAELVRQTTELAARQLSAGNENQASATLKLVQQYAGKIGMGVAGDSKKLKDSELLVEHASYRLKDMLSAASYEDQPAVLAVLQQVQQTETRLMMQVFKK